MSATIKGLLLALSIGFAAQSAHAGGDYSDAVAYALSSTGKVWQKVNCGGIQMHGGISCDVAWHQVDNDPSVKFIQTGGNVLFEVYASGQIWMSMNSGASWINAGIDSTVKSPTQLSVGRSEDSLEDRYFIYKVSNGKVLRWVSGSTWQAVSTLPTNRTALAVSGDIVQMTDPPGGTGLRTLYHISTGAKIIDRQYGAFVGAFDEFRGSGSAAYLARFIPVTNDQETVVSTYLNNPQYGPQFSYPDLKGLAVAVQNSSGPNDVFLLLSRSSTVNDNKVMWIHEDANAVYTGKTTGPLIGSGLASGIAAATSYEVYGAGMRSYLWVLKPVLVCSITSARARPARLSRTPLLLRCPAVTRSSRLSRRQPGLSAIPTSKSD